MDVKADTIHSWDFRTSLIGASLCAFVLCGWQPCELNCIYLHLFQERFYHPEQANIISPQMRSEYYVMTIKVSFDYMINYISWIFYRSENKDYWIMRLP